MSRQVERRKGAVQIGPDVRPVRIPLFLTGATVLIALDATKWHVVHHMIGAYSGLVVFVTLIIWVSCVAVKWRQRRKGK